MKRLTFFMVAIMALCLTAIAQKQSSKTIANKAMECAELIWAGKEDEVAKHYYVSGDNITEENLDQYDGNTY